MLRDDLEAEEGRHILLGKFCPKKTFPAISQLAAIMLISVEFRHRNLGASIIVFEGANKLNAVHSVILSATNLRFDIGLSSARHHLVHDRDMLSSALYMLSC